MNRLGVRAQPSPGGPWVLAPTCLKKPRWHLQRVPASLNVEMADLDLVVAGLNLALAGLHFVPAGLNFVPAGLGTVARRQPSWLYQSFPSLPSRPNSLKSPPKLSKTD